MEFKQGRIEDSKTKLEPISKRSDGVALALTRKRDAIVKRRLSQLNENSLSSLKTSTKSDKDVAETVALNVESSDLSCAFEEGGSIQAVKETSAIQSSVQYIHGKRLQRLQAFPKQQSDAAKFNQEQNHLDPTDTIKKNYCVAGDISNANNDKHSAKKKPRKKSSLVRSMSLPKNTSQLTINSLEESSGTILDRTRKRPLSNHRARLDDLVEAAPNKIEMAAESLKLRKSSLATRLAFQKHGSKLAKDISDEIPVGEFDIFGNGSDLSQVHCQSYVQAENKSSEPKSHGSFVLAHHRSLSTTKKWPEPHQTSHNREASAPPKLENDVSSLNRVGERQKRAQVVAVYKSKRSADKDYQTGSYEKEETDESKFPMNRQEISSKMVDVALAKYDKSRALKFLSSLHSATKNRNSVNVSGKDAMNLIVENSTQSMDCDSSQLDTLPEQASHVSVSGEATHTVERQKSDKTDCVVSNKNTEGDSSFLGMEHSVEACSDAQLNLEKPVTRLTQLALKKSSLQRRKSHGGEGRQAKFNNLDDTQESNSSLALVCDNNHNQQTNDNDDEKVIHLDRSAVADAETCLQNSFKSSEYQDNINDPSNEIPGAEVKIKIPDCQDASFNGSYPGAFCFSKTGSLFVNAKEPNVSVFVNQLETMNEGSASTQKKLPCFPRKDREDDNMEFTSFEKNSCTSRPQTSFENSSGIESFRLHDDSKSECNITHTKIEFSGSAVHFTNKYENVAVPGPKPEMINRLHKEEICIDTPAISSNKHDTSDSFDNSKVKSLDFRAFGEEPENETMILDPSWDNNKVLFSEFVWSKGESTFANDIDPWMVETATNADIVLDQVCPEKQYDSIEGLILRSGESDDLFNPVGWPLPAESCWAHFQPSYLFVTSENSIESCDDDNEDLLGKCHHYETDSSSISRVKLSKEERIKMYNDNRSDNSSREDIDSDDNELSRQSDDDSLTAEAEVGYIPDASDDSDNELASFDAAPLDSLQLTEADFVSSFDVNAAMNHSRSDEAVEVAKKGSFPVEKQSSNIAATQSSILSYTASPNEAFMLHSPSSTNTGVHEPREEDESLIMGVSISVANGITKTPNLVDYIQAPPPPPPLLPVGTKVKQKKNRNTITSAMKKGFTLIPPIPEAKLRKWGKCRNDAISNEYRGRGNNEVMHTLVTKDQTSLPEETTGKQMIPLHTSDDTGMSSMPGSHIEKILTPFDSNDLSENISHPMEALRTTESVTKSGEGSMIEIPPPPSSERKQKRKQKKNSKTGLREKAGLVRPPIPEQKLNNCDDSTSGSLTNSSCTSSCSPSEHAVISVGCVNSLENGNAKPLFHPSSTSSRAHYILAREDTCKCDSDDVQGELEPDNSNALALFSDFVSKSAPSSHVLSSDHHNIIQESTELGSCEKLEMRNESLIPSSFRHSNISSQTMVNCQMETDSQTHPFELSAEAPVSDLATVITLQPAPKMSFSERTVDKRMHPLHTLEFMKSLSGLQEPQRVEESVALCSIPIGISSDKDASQHSFLQLKSLPSIKTSLLPGESTVTDIQLPLIAEKNVTKSIKLDAESTGEQADLLDSPISEKTPTTKKETAYVISLIDYKGGENLEESITDKRSSFTKNVNISVEFMHKENDIDNIRSSSSSQCTSLNVHSQGEMTDGADNKVCVLEAQQTLLSSEPYYKCPVDQTRLQENTDLKNCYDIRSASQISEVHFTALHQLNNTVTSLACVSNSKAFSLPSSGMTDQKEPEQPLEVAEKMKITKNIAFNHFLRNVPHSSKAVAYDAESWMNTDCTHALNKALAKLELSIDDHRDRMLATASTCLLVTDVKIQPNRESDNITFFPNETMRRRDKPVRVAPGKESSSDVPTCLPSSVLIDQPKIERNVHIRIGKLVGTPANSIEDHGKQAGDSDDRQDRERIDDIHIQVKHAFSSCQCTQELFENNATTMEENTRPGGPPVLEGYRKTVTQDGMFPFESDLTNSVSKASLPESTLLAEHRMKQQEGTRIDHKEDVSINPSSTRCQSSTDAERRELQHSNSTPSVQGKEKACGDHKKKCGREVYGITNNTGFTQALQGYPSAERTADENTKTELLSARSSEITCVQESCNIVLAADSRPSAFTSAFHKDSRILSLILGYLGDPVAVCRMKMVSKAFYHYVDENEHVLIRDAVRLGGMNMNVRPYFWLWVTLEKEPQLCEYSGSTCFSKASMREEDLRALERSGKAGKWSYVIERDVPRAFGNLPPHKTGARLRTDSIVRALVTWGRSRMIRRGVKGSGDAPPLSAVESVDHADGDVTPTDTVSDWGGVTPVGSFNGSFTSSISGSAVNECEKSKARCASPAHRTRDEDLALSGNTLTDDMKIILQGKLSFILHSLAAAHPEVGYCQGMDYVVAHLLRVLKETIIWKAANGTLPRSLKCMPFTKGTLEEHQGHAYKEIDNSLVVEDTCFCVMNSFLTVYNLQHFYWPELRCLKTCCRVFERLIQVKLPVLADHFEHHELNVGLFALGWFQTLFLYLPSMPSATVCHMWDIWLVERSYKIFFRVGAAILFLSQPILLNHDLEGMMNYLNTFPDATLLSPDILIACALQIKVTNRMLMELEQEFVDQR